MSTGFIKAFLMKMMTTMVQLNVEDINIHTVLDTSRVFDAEAVGVIMQI